MVQLRVDVEAANARRQFNAAADAVDNLGEQLTDARMDALRLEGALDDAADEVRRLEQEVRDLDAAGGDSTQLRAQLTAARIAANDARDAFARANHVVDQMEDELDDARDAAQRLQRTMNRLDADANRGLRSVQRGLVGFAAQARQAGQSAAGAFSQGFSGLPTEIKGSVMGAGAVVGVLFAQAAGAALNGALLAAVGGGVLAAGVKLAATNSNLVQAAWINALTPVREEVTRFSMAFEGPLVKVASKFSDAWVRNGDAVRRMFQSVVDQVEPLADGILGLAENTLPGLERAVEASGPVLDELARDLPAVGKAVSDMFGSFAEGSDGAVKGIRAVGMLVSGTLIMIGNTVEFLSKGFDESTKRMEAWTAKLSEIPVIGGVFKDMAEWWKGFNDGGEGAIKTLDNYVPAADGAADSTVKLSVAEREAADAAHELSNKLSGLINDALGADNAMIAWEASIDKVTESVKENGRAVDIGTEKGRENVQTILSAVAAAEKKRQADIAMAGGEKASAEAVNAANAKFRAQIGELEALLLKLGFTRAQVDALLGKYREMANAPDITKNIVINTVQRGGSIVTTKADGSKSVTKARFERYGGIRYAADGLVSLGGAGIFKAGRTMYGFAEPGTGGEAFIARNAPKARSLAIADAAARWHGGRVVTGNDRATGGMGGGNLTVRAELVSTGGPRSNDYLRAAFEEEIKAGRLRLRVTRSGAVTVG